jgi:hypothetical protein
MKRTTPALAICLLPALIGTSFGEPRAATGVDSPGQAAPAPAAAIDHLWVVFKTHLDIGYTEPIDEVLKRYREGMMERALTGVEATRALPNAERFSWTLAGWPLSHVLGPRQDPLRRERISEAVRHGEITFHALPFTTHTETHDLEDLVRGLGYSSRLARRFGKPLPIAAKMTDVPSHSWVMPTLLTHAGVRFLHLGCNPMSARMRVPPLFWWEGPDGSRVLCAYTSDYGSGLRPPREWPARNYLAMVMTGDNQGPPKLGAVEQLRRDAAKQLPLARLHIGTLDDFAKAVIAENPELPVVRGDMPDTWIHGWMSMPQEAKAVRESRALSPAVEMLDTQLRTWGVETGELAPALAEAYDQSGLFSEHTFGPARPTRGVWNHGLPRYLYGDDWKMARANGAYQTYEQAFDDKRAFARSAHSIISRELATRLDRLAAAVAGNAAKVTVFNPLPWPRSGLVAVPGHPDRMLLATAVPAGGYRTYRLEDATTFAGDPGSNTSLETPFFNVLFDLRRGGIASLIETSTGRELVDQDSPQVIGQFLHECFDEARMAAYHNAYGQGRAPYSWFKGSLPPGIQYLARTPGGWRLSRKHSGIADVITLTAGDTLGLAESIALEFTFPRSERWVEVAWKVTRKTPDPLPEGGWLCFPFAMREPRFTLGRLAAPVDPARDLVAGSNRHYFCLNNGLMLSGPDGTGIGVCPLDAPCVSLGEPGLWRFSLDTVPRQPAVFVNLYNNQWNTNFPEWQEGSWTSRVRVWPTGSPDPARGLIVPAWKARVPLLAAVSQGTGGTLPPERPGLGLSKPGVLVTAFGRNPDGDGLLLRLWDQTGTAGTVTVRLPEGLRVTRARAVDLRGEPLGLTLPITDGRIEVPLKPFAPCSLLLDP